MPTIKEVATNLSPWLRPYFTLLKVLTFFCFLFSSLSSAYKDVLNREVEYTTWKFRDDGEHIQTLDYIFYSPDQMKVDSVLQMPTGEQIGENRLPSFNYASDHFSLLADLRLII